MKSEPNAERRGRIFNGRKEGRGEEKSHTRAHIYIYIQNVPSAHLAKRQKTSYTGLNYIDERVAYTHYYKYNSGRAFAAFPPHRTRTTIVDRTQHTHTHAYK